MAALLEIRIRNYKHNHSGQTATIPLARQPLNNPCHVRSLEAFISLRGNHDGPLFAFRTGEGITRSWFSTKFNILLGICQLDSKVFKGHSFRIGGASLAAARSLSDAQIRSLGRWTSNAFEKYLRPTAL